MYQVVKRIKSSFAVVSALFITLVTSKVRGHQACGSEKMVQCAKPLSVLTDNGLTFVSSRSDLDKICPDLKEALRCIHSFTRQCMINEHRRHFKKLFHGTGLMVHDICRNGTYQAEYLKYAPCMKEVSTENNRCLNKYSTAMKEIQSKSPDLNVTESEFIYRKKKREAADEGIKNICCAFQEFVDCSTAPIRSACGDGAADFSRNFMDRMSLSMIQLHCTEYGQRECGFISSSASLASSLFLLTILTLTSYFLR